MYKLIDLFCGIGGFSYGFEMTKKFETVLGVDAWDVALDTFSANHKKTTTELSDIKELNKEYWSKYSKKIDVIIAGPPCQGFSMAGKRDFLDERNNLFQEVMRIVSIVRPKVVVIENVLGLLSMKNQNGDLISKQIVDNLDSLGYFCKFEVLTASNYGVPQNRKRVIFIASINKNIKFPKITHGTSKIPFVTVGDALGNIPDEGKNYLSCTNAYQKLMTGPKEISNHETISHAAHIIERMRNIPQGGNWQDIPLHLGQGGGKHSNNYKRLKESEPSITIKHVSKSMIIHPKYHRTPTIREVARLQSFDDNFILYGTKYNQHQQLANAVPPLLGKAIGETVIDLLEDINA